MNSIILGCKNDQFFWIWTRTEVKMKTNHQLSRESEFLWPNDSIAPLKVLSILILLAGATSGFVIMCILCSSRQRISSRSIQETMERLAQASQVTTTNKLLIQHNYVSTPAQLCHFVADVFCLHCASFMHIEVWNYAISRRGPEDPVPDGRGVQEERPVWEGAATSEPNQPRSFQTGAFITHSHAVFTLHHDVIISVFPMITSPTFQEFGSFTSGITARINRWRNKANQSVSSHSPVVSYLYWCMSA